MTLCHCLVSLLPLRMTGFFGCLFLAWTLIRLACICLFEVRILAALLKLETRLTLLSCRLIISLLDGISWFGCVVILACIVLVIGLVLFILLFGYKFVSKVIDFFFVSYYIHLLLLIMLKLVTFIIVLLFIIYLILIFDLNKN